MKLSHFTEAKIYVKLDPKAANTARSYHLKSLTKLRQTPKIIEIKEMKKKKRNKKCVSHEFGFLLFIPGLIGPIFIYMFIYIYII